MMMMASHMCGLRLPTELGLIGLIGCQSRWLWSTLLWHSWRNKQRMSEEYLLWRIGICLKVSLIFW
jgi:hypothetical protein